MRTVLVCSFALVLGACTTTSRTRKPAPPRAVRVVSTALDARPLLNRAARLARAAGAGELQPIGVQVLGRGEQLGSFVELPVTDCLLAVARSGGGVRDADVFVFGDAGERLAADEAPDANASVLLCPPHPRRVYVTARLVGGVGMLALGVARLPQRRAKAVATALSARGLPRDDSGALAAWPGLDRVLRERRRASGVGWKDVRRVAVPLDQRAYTALSLRLEADRCLDVLVTPSDEIVRIEALVRDAAGRVVARGRPPGRDVTFLLCSQLDTRLTLMLRPAGSNGSAAVVVGQSERGVAAQLEHHLWVDAATAIVPMARALARWHERLGLLGATVSVAPPKAVVLRPRRLAELRLHFDDGCTRIDLIGGRPLGHFSAELWTAGELRLARAEGTEHAALFRCGHRGELGLELRAIERGGPLRIERRRSASTAKLLIQHPRAASALLAQLDARRGPISAAAATAVRAVGMDADRRSINSLTVPARRCVEVIAAVGRAGRGLGLTLRDADGSEQRRHGVHSVAAGACAGTSPRRLSVVLELDVGHGPVLVLEGQRKP